MKVILHFCKIISHCRVLVLRLKHVKCLIFGAYLFVQNTVEVTYNFIPLKWCIQGKGCELTIKIWTHFFIVI